MAIEVGYDWPAKALHQNARVHFMVRAKAAKKARADAHWATMQAQVPTTHTRLIVEFYPPARPGPTPDVQNIIGACKPLIDGIADALRVDDRHLLIDWPPRHAQREGAGIIRVRFEEVKR